MLLISKIIIKGIYYIMFSLNKSKKIYLLGIGGASMSALAIILKEMGHQVAGTDVRYGEYYNTLTERGILVEIGGATDMINDADLIVSSLAVKKDNADYKKAEQSGKPILSRTELLQILDRSYPFVVAVSGTHGKSTTTFLISSIMKNAGLRATYHIGASSEKFPSGGAYTGREYFVSEACEYRDSFLSFTPSIAVVLNIEKDHPDYFASKEQLESSFVNFCKNVRKDGTVVVSTKVSNLIKRELKKANREDVKVITIGDGGDYYYKDVVTNKKTEFTVVDGKGDRERKFCLNLKGEHNVLNALFTIAVCDVLKLDEDIVKSTLANTCGLRRRYEKIANYNGADVILDYAHHPSEIKKVISTAKESTNGRLLVCFQPHTYSRTTALFDEFVDSFDGASEVIITKTYKSREEKNGKTAFDLFLALGEKMEKVSYFDEFLPIVKYLKDNLQKGDVLLILGAGDIDDVGKLIKSTK